MRLLAAMENNDTSSEEQSDAEGETVDDKNDMGECNQVARVGSTLRTVALDIGDDMNILV